MPKWMSEFTVPPDDKDGVTGIKFEDSGQAVIMYCPLEDEMTDLIDPLASEGFLCVCIHGMRPLAAIGNTPNISKSATHFSDR